MAQPRKKATRYVCSVCDLDWEKHGPKPTQETCIELLKAELKAPRRNYYPQISSGTTSPWYFGTTTNQPPPNQ